MRSGPGRRARRPPPRLDRFPLRSVKGSADGWWRGHTLRHRVLLEERSDAVVIPQPPSDTALVGVRSQVRGVALFVAACVAIAALTLLLPSAPTVSL